MDFIVIFASFVALCQAGSISRYDWHDASDSGDATDVYRSLTSDQTLSRSPSLDSLAQSAIRRGDDAGGYLPKDDSNDDYGPDDTDKDDGGAAFSIHNLSDDKRRLLTEILSTVYEDDGLSLDVFSSTKASVGSEYGDDDDKSSDDKAEEIIADILGSTTRSGTSSPTTGSRISALD
ncbi:hypothetical protein EGW08_013786, partial [Elysia chlorotica]